jgi:hypothetical protein
MTADSKAQHSNIANGFAALGSTVQWRRVGPLVRQALSLKYGKTNGDLCAALRLVQPQETPERISEMAKAILQNEDVKYLENVLHQQLIEIERDARAKDL